MEYAQVAERERGATDPKDLEPVQGDKNAVEQGRGQRAGAAHKAFSQF